MAVAVALAGAAGSAQAGAEVSSPHPAIARVVAAERGGTSCGSGTLVAVQGHLGLVVTNWHVVRDAAGPIQVIFPDGFQSAATLVATDADWDLASLLIWRPRVEPIPLARQAPRPGDWLTIAGYGKGVYRAVTGRCTQYLSPGRNHPFEMVEIAAPAREGDSGGPILNARGELAGVLFGSSFGRTAGSHCGRVERFLAPTLARLDAVNNSATMIASTQQADSAARRSAATAAIRAIRPADALRADNYGPSSCGQNQACCPGDGFQQAGCPTGSTAPQGDQTIVCGWGAGQAEPTVGSPPTSSAEPAGSNWPFDELKTILAWIGAVLLGVHGLRWAARAAG